MSRKLIFGLALATVLISGSFTGVRADPIGPMCWAGFCPSQADQMNQSRRDMDKPDATCQGAYQNAPAAREPFGSPGF